MGVAETSMGSSEILYGEKTVFKLVDLFWFVFVLSEALRGVSVPPVHFIMLLYIFALFYAQIKKSQRNKIYLPLGYTVNASKENQFTVGFGV